MGYDTWMDDTLGIYQDKEMDIRESLGINDRAAEDIVQRRRELEGRLYEVEGMIRYLVENGAGVE